jgi:hypothetical protein
MKILNTKLRDIFRQGSGSGKRGFRSIVKAGFAAFMFAGLFCSADAVAQYSSSSAVQDTFMTFPGQTKAIILDAQVVTSGGSSQVTSMTFNTNGTGTASNITQAKLFYSNGGSFTTVVSNATQVGSAIASPNGTFTFSGLTVNLASGTNHFWLTYDINANATVGDSVDAELTSVDVDGVTRTPMISAPVGTRLIRNNFNYNYCQLGNPGLNYAIGINTFRIADTLINYTILGSFTVTKIPNVVSLGRGLNYPFSYKNGTFQTGNSYEKIYIDVDNDGYFDNTNELFFSGTTIVSDSNSGTIMLPCTTALGNHRIRIQTDYGTGLNACYTGLGNAFEFIMNVKDPLVSYPPDANYTTPNDTAFAGEFVRMTNTSTNALGYNYNWDYENLGNGHIDATTKHGIHQFNTPGLKQTKLRMFNTVCGTPVADSILKSIFIQAPSSKPQSEFISDRNITSPAIIVKFTDISNWGPNKWHWKITPATINGSPAYIYVNGTDSTSANPQVQFLELGLFTVSMFSENLLGAGPTITKINYINNIAVVSMCSITKTNEASGFLADEGGVGSNYTVASPGKTCTFLIQPCASAVTFSFLDFDMNSYGSTGCPTLSGDNLKIYDGIDATGNPLHVAAGFPGGFTNNPNNSPLPNLPSSVTATSGSMYIEYFVNCNGVGRGFFGEWKSVPASVASPVTAFTSTDTAYTNVPYVFTNTTKGTVDKYFWDFDSNGSPDATTTDANISFATIGTHTVTLTAERCGSPVSFAKSIFVIAQTTKPVAQFSATRTSAVVNDTLRLMDESLNGPTTFSWTISPATGWQFANGTNANSRNPFLVFNQVGTYTIKLVASNSFGTDSVTKTTYISIFSYCTPQVVNLSSDIGLSKVVFGSINNSTPIGISAYTRYNQSTTVERGATYPITLERTSNFNNVNHKVWIDFNKNGSFNDAGDEVASGGSSSALVFNANITIPKGAALGIARMRIGVSSESNNNLSCGPNAFGEFEDYNILIIDDITKPIITLVGITPLHIEQSVPFTDPGATAMDNSDGNISNLIVATTNLDTNKVGQYWIVYNVTDLSGNIADSVVRYVVVDPDHSGPVIDLLGGDTIYHLVNTPYVDAGATAFDYVDGNMSSSITKVGNVDDTKLGTYYITYNAVDLNGNAGTNVRVVYVVDNIAPVITLVGADPITIDYGKTFIDPGTTVSDNFYTGIVATSSNNVNVNQLGTYVLTYSAVDPSGNHAIQITRTVHVVDVSAPVITLLGPDTMILDVFAPYNDPGTLVDDNHTKNMVAQVTGFVDNTKLGVYPVTYTATDSSGNTATKNRVVIVLDRERPVIHLNGSSLVSLRRWSVYNDAGVTIDDNYDSDSILQPKLVVTNTVNANVEGLYQVCYNVTDFSGNKAVEVCRLVDITSANSVGEISLDEAVTIFPNPNNGVFNISMNADRDVKIEIYNSFGALIRQLDQNAAAGNNYVVDLSSEAAGIYFVRIDSGNQSITKRISYQR